MPHCTLAYVELCVQDAWPTESTEEIFLAREGLNCRAWPKLHPCRSKMAFRPCVCVSVSMEMISDVIRLTLNTWKANQSFGSHCPANRNHCTLSSFTLHQCVALRRM